MEKTRSEQLFEQFCHENSIRFLRIEPEIDAKTPDYDIFPQEHHVVAEIKELQANDADKTAWREAMMRGRGCAFSDPRDRIRRIIGSAYKQLKRRNEGLHPAVVVLFDNGTFGGIDATDIKNAMYGDEIAEVTRYHDGGASVITRLGGGRKCTATDNRSLSAVALLWVGGGGTVRLSVFHNVFTQHPLSPEWLTSENCGHYTIKLDGIIGLPDWQRA